MNKRKLLVGLISVCFVTTSSFAFMACEEELKTFDYAKFEDTTYLYDGLEKSLEVSGAPRVATISYSPDNTYTDVGEYEITATLTADGYETLNLTATLTIEYSEEYLLKSQVENLIDELESAIVANKADADGKIATLTSEYQAEVLELEQSITENVTALTALETAYNAKVKELEDTAKANKQTLENALATAKTDLQAAITVLETEYESKVTELEETASANKAELEERIASLNAELITTSETLANLQTAYNAKVQELAQADAENKLALEQEITALDGKITTTTETLANLQTVYNAKVVELEQADEANKAALEAEIASLNEQLTQTKSEVDTFKGEYNAKVEELERTAQANKEELQAEIEELQENLETANANFMALQSAYNTAISNLQAVDTQLQEDLTALTMALNTAKTIFASEIERVESETVTAIETLENELTQAIDQVKAEADEEISAIQTAIDAANAQISANKTALENQIATLQTATDTKISQIETLIATVQATDITQNEKIAELLARIVEIEKELSEQHVHTFGDWTQYSQESDVNQILFRVCLTCSEIEWKLGSHTAHNWKIETTDPTCQAQGYDIKTCTICGKVEVENYTPIVNHAWSEEYSFDNSYHWHNCKTCDETKDKVEHDVLDTGECSICGNLVGATEGVLYDISADGTYAEVIGYEGTAKHVRIADTYQGVSVTSIYSNAFSGESITSIFIPDSITSSGYGAFQNCKNLTAVYIESMEAWCNIDFYSNFDSNPLNNTIDLYLNNQLVSDLVIPDSITLIKPLAFIRGNFKTIVIPDSVTSIGAYAFTSCKNLTSVTIGDSVTSIGAEAFKSCTNLISVTMGNSVTSIGNEAFFDCTNLTFNEYGNCRYLGNEENPYVAIIRAIDTNFSSYTIHENTNVIANFAFYSCSRMSSMIILGSIVSIGDNAFLYCSSLINIYYNGTIEDWGKILIGSSNSRLTSATRYYYSESAPTTDGNYWHYDENGNPVVW